MVVSSTRLLNRRCVLEEKLSTKAMVKRTPLLFLATFIATLLATFLAIFLFVPPLWAQKSSDQPPAKGAAPAESKVPPSDAARVNSVKPSAESLAKGKKLYGIDCRSEERRVGIEC